MVRFSTLNHAILSRSCWGSVRVSFHRCFSAIAIRKRLELCGVVSARLACLMSEHDRQVFSCLFQLLNIKKKKDRAFSGRLFVSERKERRFLQKAGRLALTWPRLLKSVRV
jgi:hypothetical protein